MRARQAGARRLAVLLMAGMVAAPAVSAAQSQPPAPKVVVTEYDMKKAAAAPSLSEVELAGKQLFVQRCALCHDLLGQPATGTVGPWVDAETIKRSEEAARQKINMGSRTMPGWRYTLTPPQVDQIIAYLKTVTPDQKPKVPGSVVVPID
jgi:mono/diheme cytochrome c family protein